MADALQRRGLHGVGLAEVLQAAQAPKGVLYHHFPGGKQALAVAAIEALAAAMAAALDRALQRQADPVAALRDWLAAALKQLERSGYERGCPLATVALESGPGDGELRAALSRGFTTLRARLGHGFTQAGVEPARAAALATLTVAAYEGALMQSRVAGNAQPMRDTAALLVDMLARELH